MPAHQGPPHWCPDGGRSPLISGTMTCGVLGFVKCRGRRWKPEAIHTLTTIASLFAQFRARISAEDRLRHLAEHDDLTGLSNRRVLLAHLSDRLAVRQPGPVALLYIDLDRLKAINDSLGHAAGDWYIQTSPIASVPAPEARARSPESVATSSSLFQISR
jgi:GAF domain-containing protein